MNKLEFNKRKNNTENNINYIIIHINARIKPPISNKLHEFIFTYQTI